LRAQDYGTPEAYLNTLAPLLGQQAWQGSTESEGACGQSALRSHPTQRAHAPSPPPPPPPPVCTGGFAPGKVSVANVLTVGSRSTAGKTYYQYEILTRTADGDEGGRHHLFACTVSNGKLYIMKLQAGDKRWFKGLERELKKVQESFSVA
jgi:hypothetical protein